LIRTLSLTNAVKQRFLGLAPTSKLLSKTHHSYFYWKEKFELEKLNELFCQEDAFANE
jgi:hypothetical protein